MRRPQEVRVILNPAARGAPTPEAIEAAAEPLRTRGWTVQIETSEAAGEITARAAAAAAAGVDVVVACGGDGTVHEAANGLIGSGAALAMIPTGTANIWAAEAGIPSDPEQALLLIPRARRVRADLGIAQVGEARRHFLLMCGFGLDGHVVRRVGGGSRGKRRLGRAWYGIVGAWSALRVGAFEVTIRESGTGPEADLAVEQTLPLRLGIAGNTRLYGGVTRLTSGARIDDGLLDLVTFEARGPLGTARQLGRALRGGLHRRAGGTIGYRQTAAVEIEPSGALPVQLDGEFFAEAAPGTPLRLSTAPGALTMLMAPRPTPLLGER